MAEFKYNKVNSVGVNHGTKVYGRKSAPDVGVTDQKEGIDISYHNEKVGFKNSTFGYGATNSINIQSGDKELRIEDADLGVGDNKKSVIVRKILAESGTIGGWTLSDGALTGDGTGDINIVSTDPGSTRHGVVWFETGDSTEGDWWTVFHDTSGNSNRFAFNFNGTNKAYISTSGDIQSTGAIEIGAATSKLTRDGGHVEVTLADTNGHSLFPNVHATSNTVGYDLGKSTKKWRKVYSVEAITGDLIMDNSNDARWVLREKPDCILARNCKTQKTFKLNMTETSEYSDEVWQDNG